MVELSGIISNDFLSKCRGTCKILVSCRCCVILHHKHHCQSLTLDSLFYFFHFVFKDIDSDRPMMQVGQYVFAGEYEGNNEP